MLDVDLLEMAVVETALASFELGDELAGTGGECRHDGDIVYRSMAEIRSGQLSEPLKLSGKIRMGYRAPSSTLALYFNHYMMVHRASCKE